MLFRFLSTTDSEGKPQSAVSAAEWLADRLGVADRVYIYATNAHPSTDDDGIYEGFLLHPVIRVGERNHRETLTT